LDHNPICPSGLFCARFVEEALSALVHQSAIAATKKEKTEESMRSKNPWRRFEAGGLVLIFGAVAIFWHDALVTIFYPRQGSTMNFKSADHKAFSTFATSSSNQTKSIGADQKNITKNTTSYISLKKKSSSSDHENITTANATSSSNQTKSIGADQKNITKNTTSYVGLKTKSTSADDENITTNATSSSNPTKSIGAGQKNTTKNANLARNSTKKSTSCCYHSKVNLTQKFTRKFFDDTRKNDVAHAGIWNGKEYDEWKNVVYPAIMNYSNYCEREWRKFILGGASGMYIRTELNTYTKHSVSRRYGFVPDQADMPRVLILGDSISGGTWEVFSKLFSNSSIANFHGPPDNCGGFSRYSAFLTSWLGECPWDVIQFNVGMHFHLKPNESMDSSYREGLAMVVEQLRRHSPAASLVFAFTTPSPFDSNDTTPDEATCVNYHHFHKKGFVSKLNDIARDFVSSMNITINDRYQAILPFIGQQQRPCDIHFNEAGYKLIAKQDISVISKLLSK